MAEKLIKGIKIGDNGDTYLLKSSLDAEQETKLENLEGTHRIDMDNIEAKLTALQTALDELRDAFNSHINYEDEDPDNPTSLNSH